MRFAFLCLLLLLAVSCNSPKQQQNSQAKIDLLAERSCRAIRIRQQRFELANRIQFAQDTLATSKSKKDSLRLQTVLGLYLKQKDTLLKRSLSLADTIHRQLDSLVPYTDKAAQQKFTRQLDSLLAKKGCKLPDQTH